MSFHAGASCLPYQWRGETILTHDQQLHHLRVQKERFQFFQLGLRTRTHHIFTIKPGSDITMRPATLGSIDRVSSDGPALSMWLDALAEKRSAGFCSLVLIKRHPYLHRYDRSGQVLGHARATRRSEPVHRRAGGDSDGIAMHAGWSTMSRAYGAVK
jgi:hypothetical protein